MNVLLQVAIGLTLIGGALSAIGGGWCFAFGVRPQDEPRGRVPRLMMLAGGVALCAAFVFLIIAQVNS